MVKCFFLVFLVSVLDSVGIVGEGLWYWLYEL